MDENKLYDIVIIGAGAAGLMAAWELVQTGKKVLIVEAKNRCGGRIHTIKDKAFPLPIELGAEFVHGKLPITQMLVKKAGVKWEKIKGSIWQNTNGKWMKAQEQFPHQKEITKALEEVKEDITISTFLDTYFSNDTAIKEGLTHYIEGYYAGEINRVNVFAFKEELEKGDDRQYRIKGGYQTIIDFLEKAIMKNGGAISFQTPITSIDWQPNYVKLISGHKVFQAQKVLITVPLGVLMADAISFSPIIPTLKTALNDLGFGTAIKINLSFKTAFWHKKTKLKKLSMFFSDQVIPTWWTQYPKDVPMLTGWAAGGEAKNLINLNKEVLLGKSLQSLATIFNKSQRELEKELKGWYVNNWYKGTYARGAYSYDTINGSYVKSELQNGIENTIFFAGEGWFDGLELGTVEAALNNGREAANHLKNLF